MNPSVLPRRPSVAAFNTNTATPNNIAVNPFGQGGIFSSTSTPSNANANAPGAFSSFNLAGVNGPSPAPGGEPKSNTIASPTAGVVQGGAPGTITGGTGGLQSAGKGTPQPSTGGAKTGGGIQQPLGMAGGKL
jgi:hypothetical protein